MTSTDSKTVHAVTTKLLGGPYAIEAPQVGGWAYVTNVGSGRLKDHYGHAIAFAIVDAEKLVRLYNEDHFANER